MFKFHAASLDNTLPLVDMLSCMQCTRVSVNLINNECSLVNAAQSVDI